LDLLGIYTGLDQVGSAGEIAQGLGLPNHLKFVKGHFVFQEIPWTNFMGVRRGGKRVFATPPRNWD